MFNLLMTVMVLATLASIYIFWLRPFLKTRPSFAEFYARSDGFWSAVSLWLQGMKQKITAMIVIAGGAIVSMHDWLVPVVSGVNVQPLVDSVPKWAWPLGMIAITALLQYFRSLTDRRPPTD